MEYPKAEASCLAQELRRSFGPGAQFRWRGARRHWPRGMAARLSAMQLMALQEQQSRREATEHVRRILVFRHGEVCERGFPEDYTPDYVRLTAPRVECSLELDRFGVLDQGAEDELEAVLDRLAEEQERQRL